MRASRSIFPTALALAVVGASSCGPATTANRSNHARARTSSTARPVPRPAPRRSDARESLATAGLLLRHHDYSRHRIFAERVRYLLDGKVLWEEGRGTPPRLEGYQLAFHRHPDFDRTVELRVPTGSAHTLTVELEYAMQRCCYAGCRWGLKAKVRHSHRLEQAAKARALCIESGYLAAVVPDLEVKVSPCAHPPMRPAARPSRPRAPAMVACEATLVRVDPKHHWSEDHGDGHDDGVAPLAVFRVTAPRRHVGRRVGILFKYTSPQQVPSAAQVGKRFAFEVPAPFFNTKHWILDNLSVRGLRQLPRRP